MKIKCNKEKLYKGFQVISGIINQNTTKTILQNVKFDVKDDLIDLYVTDLEVSIKYRVENDENFVNFENGTVIVPEIKLETILKDWVEDFVEIETIENNCHIYGENCEFHINGEANIDQFPEEPIFSELNFIEINPFLLSSMIKRTIFVITGERIRYTLSGVFFKVEGSNLFMVSTDGRRLSRVSTTIDNPDNITFNCIVPVKGLIQLEKAITNSYKTSGTNSVATEVENIKLKIEGNSILFKSKKFQLFAQLIDGDYPDYNKIIPDNSNFEVLINTKKLNTAVKRASVVTKDGSKLVRLSFEKNNLTLTAEVSTVGNSKIIVDIDFDHDKFEIGFNPDFILEALNVVSSDMVELNFTDQGLAGTISETFGEDDRFLHVIMPVNLRED